MRRGTKRRSRLALLVHVLVNTVAEHEDELVRQKVCRHRGAILELDKKFTRAVCRLVLDFVNHVRRRERDEKTLVSVVVDRVRLLRAGRAGVVDSLVGVEVLEMLARGDDVGDRCERLLILGRAQERLIDV